VNHIVEYLVRTAGSRRIDCLVLLALFAPALFLHLGRSPLLVPDEARYAEIPREMLESGDFITPRLNYVVYFDKPALYYWLNALSFTVFGETEFSARLFSALAGLGTILLTWRLGWALYGRRVALFSALILGTSVGFVVQARLNTIDMTLTFLMTATLCAFVAAARRGGDGKAGYYYLAYACTALMVLAKGLIGIVLPGVIMLICVALYGRWRLIPRMRPVRGLLLILLLCAPWFILVSVRNPGFVRYFFVHEQFQRFLSTHHQHSEPFWYFIPILAGLMFPWSWFLPVSLLRSARRIGRGAGLPDLFFFVWAAVIFVFFSSSGSKLASYILPMFPAAALLTGRMLSSAMDDGISSLRRQALCLAALLYAGAVGILIYPLVARHPNLSAVGCATIGIALACGGMLAARAIRRADIARYFLGLVVTSYAWCVAGPPFVLEGWEHSKSLKELATIVRAEARPGDTVLSFDFYAQDIPFYARRRVASVDVPRELEYGSAQGDQTGWFMDYGQFYALWDSRGTLFVIIHEDDMPTLATHARTPARVLGKKGHIILITNRPARPRSGAMPAPD